VTVLGFGQGYAQSEQETSIVTVLLNPPVVHFVTHDTSIWANDSVQIFATGSDPNGSVISYCWLIDTISAGIFSKKGTLTCWFGAQSAVHCIHVSVMDDDSIVSAMDSVHVRVMVNPPLIRAGRDTAIPINDTVLITAVRLDTFSSEVRWVWARNGTLFSDTTAVGSFKVRFAQSETGDRRVLVKAIDAHHIESNTDSVHIRVHLDPPVVSIVHDTIVPINDPVVLHALAIDTNGFIARYIWAFDGVHFTDTTSADSVVRVYSKSDTGRRIVVLVKAVDDDTIASSPDSVRIVVRLKPSPFVAITKDTNVFINDTFTIAAKGTESGSHSPVMKYVWAVDKFQFDDTTETGIFSLCFPRLAAAGRHVVRVKSVDRDTMESLDDSLVVQVRLGTPVVTAMKDTAVFINDTAVVHVWGTDTNGSVIRYVWSFDGGPFTDTTMGGMFKKTWAKPNAGRHVIRVFAIDDDSLQSVSVPCTVVVRLGTPVVTAMKDTAVFINDTASLHASGADSNGTILRYAWSFDNGPFTDTTTAGLIRKVWGKQDTGRHTVRVIAVDNDTIQSPAGSFAVRVRLGMPVIRPVRDTALTWGETLSVVVSATDTNGTVLEYLSDTGLAGAWTDSSGRDTLRFTSNNHCRKKTVIGVRDDDGLVSADTFFIDYKAVRCTVSVREGPKSGDTVFCTTKKHKKIITPLSFTAARNDGVVNTFAYSLWSGLSPSALVKSYQGADTACTLTTLDSGTYYWKIVAIDSHNDTVQTALSNLAVLLQRRICFIGHSIMVGLGGDAGLGGLRSVVLDTLRANVDDKRKIWCEGPLNTPPAYPGMLPVEDDSCLAVTGRTSAAIYDSLRIYSSTAADMWVYMNGVNEWYMFPTYYLKYGYGNYSILTIDSMHSRNPQGEIYVFNGLPFPADTNACLTRNLDTVFTNHLPLFNHMLDTAITHRRQTWQQKGEAGVWLVDVNTPLSMPDGHYNPAYFWDCLHPNQAGYDLMANQLFNAMRQAKSTFIK
jgi:hypothetical protein